MRVRVLIILSMLVAISIPGAAAQETTQTTTTTTTTTETTQSPTAHGVREKLGSDFQFLLHTPPPSGGKVSPGDAHILRSLCGTCTPNKDNPWSTVVVTRKDGTTVTLADLYRMHRDGAGWGEIAKRELGVKLGTLVRESASGRQFMTTPKTRKEGTTSPPSSSTGTGSEAGAQTGIVTGSGRPGNAHGHGHARSGGDGSGIVTGSGRSLGGSAVHHGHGGEKAGIVTGSGREVGGHGRGGLHRSSSPGHGRGK